MYKSIVIIAIFSFLAMACSSEEDELVWSDEFEYTGIPDPDRWGFQLGDGCPNICGWGNNEKQHYTSDEKNVRVENGVLIIEALKEEKENSNYTSSKVVSTGKGDWKYGRIEVRAKLPHGKGTWPAIWMLPTLENRSLDWPRDGEIDIMEHVGYNQGMVFGTIHTEKYNHVKGTQKSDSIYIEDAHEKFYTYSIDWTPESISWFVDDEKYLTIDKNGDGVEGWPFDHPFHLILNVAVGGNWGGKYGIDDTIWPQRMEVDYVRVYKN